MLLRKSAGCQAFYGIYSIDLAMLDKTPCPRYATEWTTGGSALWAERARPLRGEPRMQSTKSQILAALKRQGHCSVDELAAQLSLAPMTVRQHLAMLERDSLVESHEERQRLGRPHFVFVLTEKGEASFPKQYDEIARQLLSEVGRL